jgi:hypothetical protein
MNTAGITCRANGMALAGTGRLDRSGPFIGML